MSGCAMDTEGMHPSGCHHHEDTTGGWVTGVVLWGRGGRISGSHVTPSKSFRRILGPTIREWFSLDLSRRELNRLAER